MSLVPGPKTTSPNESFAEFSLPVSEISLKLVILAFGKFESLIPLSLRLPISLSPLTQLLYDTTLIEFPLEEVLYLELVENSDSDKVSESIAPSSMLLKVTDRFLFSTKYLKLMYRFFLFSSVLLRLFIFNMIYNMWYGKKIQSRNLKFF